MASVAAGNGFEEFIGLVVFFAFLFVAVVILARLLWERGGRPALYRSLMRTLVDWRYADPADIFINPIDLTGIAISKSRQELMLIRGRRQRPLAVGSAFALELLRGDEHGPALRKRHAARGRVVLRVIADGHTHEVTFFHPRQRRLNAPQWARDDEQREAVERMREWAHRIEGARVLVGAPPPVAMPHPATAPAGGAIDAAMAPVPVPPGAVPSSAPTAYVAPSPPAMHDAAGAAQERRVSQRANTINRLAVAAYQRQSAPAPRPAPRSAEPKSPAKPRVPPSLGARLSHRPAGPHRDAAE